MKFVCIYLATAILLVLLQLGSSPIVTYHPKRDMYIMKYVHKKKTLLDGMVAFLYTKGIQLTAAHSGGRCSVLTQEEVQHLWRYNLHSQG